MCGMCRHMRVFRQRATRHGRLALLLERRRRRALQRLSDPHLALSPLLPCLLLPRNLIMQHDTVLN